jgi:hypothetical protein
MSHDALPDWFGRVYRDAVFDAGAPAEVLRLQQVLLDWAYTGRSFVVTASERVLRGEARLHGRSLQRARDWLLEHRLLEYDVAKPGRGPGSRYELRLPEMPPEKPAQERAFRGEETPAETPAGTPAGKPAGKPAQERTRSKSLSRSGEDALARVGPQKRELNRDLRARANRRRGGVTNDDVRAIVERMEAEEAPGQEDEP